METLIGIGALISGGFVWEIFKFFFPDLRKYFDAKITAKNNFFSNIDPILKSSSELFGKLESLAKEDFATFINQNNSNSNNPQHNQKYVYYLFAQFWAHLEYIRMVSQYNSLTSIKKGRELLRFIETFESRKYRILDRSLQRIIGESLIENSKNKFKIMSMNEFVNNLNSPNSNLKPWIDELETYLLLVNDLNKRQTVLRYGVVLSIFIDHFDSDYKIVRRRQVYRNKLSKKSRLMIKYNLLKHYLNFIENPHKFF